MEGRAFIGCSGWQYASWAGPFYPAALGTSEWLRYYSRRFSTVEVNNTFYRLPEASTFAAWRNATPPGFVMAVKASRYLTHLKRLQQPSRPIARLLARAFALGPRLGPILYQLPATLEYDDRRLTAFLDALTAQSRRFLLRNRASRRPRVRRLRHVVEFRHPSWYRDDVFSALARSHVAVCLHDMPGSSIDRAPEMPFLYVRFHGTTSKYRGKYSDAALRTWSRRMRRSMQDGRDVYAYFNNDLGGAAVENARTLIRYVGQPRS